MPASVASLVFALGIAGLFFLDRDDDPRPSRALWLPVVWMIIGASRTPSQWLSGEISTAQVDLYLDGSPWDRLFLSAILAVGVVVLIARARRAGPLLRASGPLIVFFLYCAVSVLWSDYPLVSFKRWTKVLGNITMVLVVLTDPHPAAALKRVFARVGFFLIPLSVLLIKYYPALGRIYNRWTWTSSNTGVASECHRADCDACFATDGRLVSRRVREFRRGSGTEHDAHGKNRPLERPPQPGPESMGGDRLRKLLARLAGRIFLDEIPISSQPGAQRISRNVHQPWLDRRRVP